jgi:hypothetical protein
VGSPVVHDAAARASGAVTMRMIGIAARPTPIKTRLREKLTEAVSAEKFSSSPDSAKWPRA